MQIAGCTDAGRRYDENQDCYCAGKVNDNTFWLVLCDGMGGMEDGDLASRRVCSYMAEMLEEVFVEYAPDDEIPDLLKKIVCFSNDMLADENIKRRTGGLMGTTVVAAVVRGNNVTVAHCGDSRAYLIGKKSIKQMTKDHSVVQELVDAGKLTPQQAANHPNRNVITRALGVEKGIRPDVTGFRIQKGDILLLCSDGLSNMIQDSDILKTAMECGFFDCPNELVRKAVEAGGFDNITALMLKA